MSDSRLAKLIAIRWRLAAVALSNAVSPGDLGADHRLTAERHVTGIGRNCGDDPTVNSGLSATAR